MSWPCSKHLQWPAGRGFGRAFIPEEYAAYGLDMDDSRARFEEGFEAVVRLWTEDR